MRNRSNHHSRRSFLRAGAGLAAATIVPRCAVAGSGQTPPGEKLNLAFIGAGGRGVNNLEGLRGQNVVALCDVDLDRAKDSFKAFPQAS